MKRAAIIEILVWVIIIIGLFINQGCSKHGNPLEALPDDLSLADISLWLNKFEIAIDSDSTDYNFVIENFRGVNFHTYYTDEVINVVLTNHQLSGEINLELYGSKKAEEVFVNTAPTIIFENFNWEDLSLETEKQNIYIDYELEKFILTITYKNIGDNR